MEFSVQVKVARELLPSSLVSRAHATHFPSVETLDPTETAADEFYLLKIRMQLRLTPNGARVLTDSNKADLASTKMAIMALSGVPIAYNRRSWAVLGDLEDAGTQPAAAYRSIGQFFVENYIDRLVCVGSLAVHFAAAVIERGMQADFVHTFRTNSQALQFLCDGVGAGDVVLIKGSPAMRMEEIVDGMCAG